jgi:hypothetical protein
VTKDIDKDEDDTKDILYQGASLSQLSVLFKRDRRTVTKKLHNKIKSVGSRLGQPIYSVADAAPYLCAPNYKIEEYVEAMTVADLPTELSKEFWAGMRSRQLFEKEQGLLVPIASVRDVIGQHNKTLRERILLSKENIERQVELPDRAKVMLVETLDGLLEDLRDAIIKEFAEPIPLNANPVNYAEVTDDDDEL